MSGHFSTLDSIIFAISKKNMSVKSVFFFICENGLCLTHQ